MKNLEEAVAENAKGILASTMSQEIKELVKESLTEQDDEEEVDTEVDMDDMDDIDMDTDETEMDDVDMDMDMDMDMDTDNMDMDDEDTIDLTDVDDDEEILRVFQLMGPEDNIVVTKDDSGNISLKDEENNKEYMIVGEGEEEEEMFEQFDDEFEFEDEEDDMDDDDSEGIEDIISKVFDNDDEDSEMEEAFGGNKHDFKRRKGHKIGDVDGHFKDFESEFDEEDEMNDEEIVYEISFDEEDDMDMDLEEQDDMDMDLEEQDDMEDETMAESKMSVKPKGTGFGNPNKKKVYSNKPNQEGGFKTVKKSVNPTMGTGKAKFDYKDGENLDGKMKSVKKTETKEQVAKVDNTTKKVEPKEASRTLGNGSNFRRGGLPKPRAHSSFNTAIKESSNTSELKVLREKNEEYRKALNVFRNKLNEVAVFNSNLAYATRLFTEHSTSKQEKINILRRFDGVENIKESKNLYKVIKDELTGTTSQPMNESLERTIAKAPSTGSAINLIESKTYENPQFLRMKDLMSKLK
jgi:hypothetical protein